MTAKDNITLPREVVEQLLKMLEMVEPYADQLTDYSSTAAEWPLNLLPEKVGVAITALRTHLAAEPTKQEPGLIEGLAELARQMKPLDADMAAILNANLDSLYIEDEPALAAEQPKVSVTLNLDAMRTVSSGDAVLAASSVAVTVSSALAAEQPKPEPVAWQERHLFPGMGEWTNWYDHQRPRLAHHPLEEVHDRVRYQFRPLYAAPPDSEAMRREET